MSSDEKHIEAFWKDQFEQVGKHPITWLMTALELRYAAKQLWAIESSRIENIKRQMKAGEKVEPEDFNDVKWPLSNIFMMISGYALENILKGLFMHRHPEAIQDGKLIRDQWRQAGHGLKELADDLTIPLTPEENDLLDRLAKFTVWAGRYPIATNHKAHRPTNVSSLDYERFNNLFDKVRTILEKEANL